MIDGETGSRLLTAVTLSFHIIYASLGVGLPVMISFVEWLGLRRHDSHYTMMARRWARGFVILVAVGVVTGTAIGLQLSLLWPRFMQVAGHVISLPLFLETFAFFFEAIFLGIYVYTWDRFKPIYHWLLSIPIVIGSTLSGFFISTVNAFMNAPSGFEIKEGVFVNVQPLEAMFNPATPTKVLHVISSSYLTGAAVLAGLTAWFLLKGHRHVYYKKALHVTLGATFLFALSTAVIGDVSGKYLAEHQPEKLAAAEWHFETEKRADLVVGGLLEEDGTIRYALELPNMLSFLATGHLNGEVIGLNAFSTHNHPPLFIHYLFDGMVAAGTYLLFLSSAYLYLQRKQSRVVMRSWFLRAVVASGPIAILATEMGWIFSEVGRQPWIIYRLLRVEEAATTSSYVPFVFIIFCMLYVILLLFTIKTLRRLFHGKTAEAELQVMNKMRRDR